MLFDVSALVIVVLCLFSACVEAQCPTYPFPCYICT